MIDDAITRALKCMETEPPEVYLMQAVRLLTVANNYAEERLAAVPSGQIPSGMPPD